MRSNWKIKNYIKEGYSSISDNESKLYKAKGFINPFFYEKRLLVYRGNIFKNFKIREEMLMMPIRSFIITRPSFSSIRMKFGGLKGGSTNKKR